MADGLSILTNAGAMAAVRELAKTQAKLDTTLLRVTTGLKVNGPRDNPAVFATAQRLRGDIAGIDADLGAESTDLVAQQVKQQFGVQALAIANAQPAIILGLFP